jgi:NAD-dependent SIR2 family protein deacetylase
MRARPLQPFFRCVYCGTVVSGEPEYTIHRDGFGEGPEVPLCSSCGGSDKPSCVAIWNKIASPGTCRRADASLN